VHARRNWSERTLRSAVETSAWLAAVMVSQAVLQDVVAAAIVGALAGLSISVFGELCMGAGAARPESALPPNADRGKIFREEAGVSVLVPKFVAPARRRKDFRPAGVTMKELATHNTRGDLWIAVEGRAYDITKYVDAHPGGWLPMVNLAGKDVTDAFANYHPARVYAKLLPSYYIGDIVDHKVRTHIRDMLGVGGGFEWMGRNKGVREKHRRPSTVPSTPTDHPPPPPHAVHTCHTHARGT
jgi:predicted heme/steroid binding protein